MSKTQLLALACACSWLMAHAQIAKSFDAAAAFGARPSVSDLHLSPDGQSVVFIAPTAGQGAAAYTLALTKGAPTKLALSSNGKPSRIERCHWVANDRIACVIYAVINDVKHGILPISRVVAVDADGKNLQVLSTRDNFNTHGLQLRGGEIVDWLPDENGAVLMTRMYLRDDRGSRLGNTMEGLGVDWVDTRTLAVKHVEPARVDAVEYMSDGRGTVRIIGTRNLHRAGEQDTGVTSYSYRLPGSRDWQVLGEFDEVRHEGFLPLSIDHDLNVVYGARKKDGRYALYSLALDGSLNEKLIFADPDVDFRDVVEIGRRNRPVGVEYATEFSHTKWFAPDVGALAQSLMKAVPGHALDIVDTSVDENRLLVLTSSDVDPGLYHLFDRSTHQLQSFLVVRRELEGVKLATVKPVTYDAADGSHVPAYLTLPPGQESAKGLPAIVMPHGGPSARDYWGFDWLAQFFAARGFAVLQPNFRGSSGYGDEWFQKNGFKSWPIAIGDVLDAGRWLVREGIADPSKLAVVGWSYGGYASLQAATVDSTLFKCVVAIAPVTDLSALKEEHRYWSNFELVSQFVGEGSHMHEGSPIEHVEKIKVPVLLFHGALDRNVNIEESIRMAAKLKAVGVKSELVTWDDLDHYLEDSSARAQMLRKSDGFLRQALGMQ